MRKNIEIIDKANQSGIVQEYLGLALQRFSNNEQYVASVLATFNGRTLLGSFRDRYKVKHPIIKDGSENPVLAVAKDVFHDCLAQTVGVDTEMLRSIALPVTHHTPSFWSNLSGNVNKRSEGTDVGRVYVDGTNREIVLIMEKFDVNQHLTKVVWGFEDSVKATEIQTRRLPRREEMSRWHDLLV